MSDDVNLTGTVGPELLGRLIDRHGAALKLYASQLCNSPDDVVQDSLVELARCRKVPEQPVAWLYRAVRYRAMTARRSARRRKHYEREAAKRRAAAVVGPPVGQLDAQTVTAALESLGEVEREVVVAHLWGGLTFQQIGQLVGISGSTAHRRYQAALSAIRKKLKVTVLCPKRN